MRELSDKSGYSLKRCRDLLIENDVEIRPPGRVPGPRPGPKLSDEDQDAMEKRYLDGDTMQEIADDAGVSKQRVHQVLKARGVSSRRRGPRSEYDAEALA